MNKYEINEKTIAILPISKTSSQIIEENKEFIVNKRPIDIIDHSCKYFGSSYEGRHIGTVAITGISYKTPIVIEETKNIIFFPTLSVRSSDCCWISLDKIENYLKNKYISTIIFKNGYELSLDISLNSLKNQIYKSTMLDSILKKRKNR